MHKLSKHANKPANGCVVAVQMNVVSGVGLHIQYALPVSMRMGLGRVRMRATAWHRYCMASLLKNCC